MVLASNIFDQLGEFFKVLSYGFIFVMKNFQAITNAIFGFINSINFSPLTIFLIACISLLVIAAIVILVIRLL